MTGNMPIMSLGASSAWRPTFSDRTAPPENCATPAALAPIAAGARPSRSAACRASRRGIVDCRHGTHRRTALRGGGLRSRCQRRDLIDLHRAAILLGQEPEAQHQKARHRPRCRMDSPIQTPGAPSGVKSEPAGDRKSDQPVTDAANNTAAPACRSCRGVRRRQWSECRRR